MRRTANIASFPSRESCLLLMLESIKGQFDAVRLYWNGTEKPDVPKWVKVINDDGDLTDLGKFRFLTGAIGFNKWPDEYYFTLDDDLIYPPTYADDMVAAIKEHGCIVTHHGRRLLGKGKQYYGGHDLTMCLKANPTDRSVDVAGTGVTAFSTDYFRPLIWRDTRMKMADLVFSEEAARRGKEIMCLAHPSDYFGYLEPENTIHETEQHNQDRLIAVANRIYQLKQDAARSLNPIQ